MTYNSRQVDPLPNYHAYNANTPALGEELINENRFQDISGVNTSSPTAQPNPAPLLVGTPIQTLDGRVFRYVRLQGTTAFVEGDVLYRAADVAVANDVVVASSDVNNIVTTQSWTVGAYAGDWFYVDGNTGAGQCRRILYNNATTLYLDRALGTVLDATSDFSIIRMLKMRLVSGSSDTLLVGGISYGAIAPHASDAELGNYGWMQVGGFCEHVIIDGVATIDDYLKSGTVVGQAIIAAGNDDFTSARCFGIALGVGGTAVKTPAVLNLTVNR